MPRTAFLAIILLLLLSTVATAGPVITVVNDAGKGEITFGYPSYKIVNGSSTRQGSGASIQVASQGRLSDFPPMGQGDRLSLDRGLQIYNQQRTLSTDGSATCGAQGVASGLSQLFGRGYLTGNDAFTVRVTAQEGVVKGLYDAVCSFSK